MTKQKKKNINDAFDDIFPELEIYIVKTVQ